jgi:hypothetical protein
MPGANGKGAVIADAGETPIAGPLASWRVVTVEP